MAYNAKETCAQHQILYGACANSNATSVDIV